MASLKKFLTYTAVAAAAVAGGIAVYKKVQANKSDCDNDFDDFDDDEFDDDFDDDFAELDDDGRNYTSITPEEAVSSEDAELSADTDAAQDAKVSDSDSDSDSAQSTKAADADSAQDTKAADAQ